MKKLSIILITLIITSISYGQCCHNPNSLNTIIRGGGNHHAVYSFQFYGDETAAFLDSLLNKLPDLKRNSTSWKIDRRNR